MKQIIQSLKSGETLLEEVPAPLVRPGHILIKTTRSLVSLGTERMLVEFGKASLIKKAKQQPDKVKMVLDKIKSDGLLPTIETVFNKLEQPMPLGYCNVGIVIGIGSGVSNFKVNDRVASNGQHAEFVCVPQNLVAHIPEEVTDEQATFTVIGSIGLQGIRLLSPTLGETVVVVGLGLIGLITAELLKANGCNVIGVDLEENKLEIARTKGIQVVNPNDGGDPVKFVQSITNGIGADGVIITASTKTNQVISQAARMSRKRGRIILVGVVGLELSRAEFYEKELSFQVSCSYGPGRYDLNYEEKGLDYPLPYVRWTEKRNFETVLQAIKIGNLVVDPLISEVVPIEQYQKVYGEIGKSQSIASILAYAKDSLPESTVRINSNSFVKAKGVLGIVGAGNFTKMTLLPLLKNANIKYIAGAGGVNSKALAKKHSISYSTSDFSQILKDPEIDTVIITTRQNLHAEMVIQGLKSGKNIFVEKPLCLNKKDLDKIIEVYLTPRNDGKTPTLTVGFNRRFSPHIQQIKSLLDPSANKNMVATMNAGSIPADVWVHDLDIGGGRIVGEACHLIDLLTYLSGSLVKSICMSGLGLQPAENSDNAAILLKFINGDQGIINYFSNGHKSYSKERLEIYSQDKTLILDNYRETKGYGFSGFSKLKTKLDKGHKTQFELLVERAKIGGEALVPFEEIINTTKATFAAIESLKKNSWITV